MYLSMRGWAFWEMVTYFEIADLDSGTRVKILPES